MTGTYRPIPCRLYDELEAAATLRRTCELRVRTEDGSTRSVRGVIRDLYARGGVEYLRLDDGLEIRLDEIDALDGTTFDAECSIEPVAASVPGGRG